VAVSVAWAPWPASNIRDCATRGPPALHTSLRLCHQATLAWPRTFYLGRPSCPPERVPQRDHGHRVDRLWMIRGRRACRAAGTSQPAGHHVRADDGRPVDGPSRETTGPQPPAWGAAPNSESSRRAHPPSTHILVPLRLPYPLPATSAPTDAARRAAQRGTAGSDSTNRPTYSPTTATVRRTPRHAGPDTASHARHSRLRHELMRRSRCDAALPPTTPNNSTFHPTSLPHYHRMRRACERTGYTQPHRTMQCADRIHITRKEEQRYAAIGRSEQLQRTVELCSINWCEVGLQAEARTRVR
jgi:hypothetical protein